MASNKLTKAQIITALCESSGLDKKAVTTVLDGLVELTRRQLSDGGPGEITIPGLVKLKAKTTPATQDRLASLSGGGLPFGKPLREQVATCAAESRVLRKQHWILGN